MDALTSRGHFARRPVVSRRHKPNLLVETSQRRAEGGVRLQPLMQAPYVAAFLDLNDPLYVTH
jgi:hypothetical protein